MKLPEKAPDFNEIFKSDFTKIVELTISDDFKKVINKANKEYLYWDNFKYQSLPENIKPEIAWCALKLARAGTMKFIPLAVPHGRHFKYWIPDSAQSYLHGIDQRAAGEILVEDPRRSKAEQKKYLMNSIQEEAISSSLIEGAATTRRKAMEMFKTGRKPRDHGEQMIYNNYLTILKIKEFINQPLTPELLKEFQGYMTKGTLENPKYEGRFRTEQDDLIEVADNEGHVLHTPPMASEIPNLIESFCNFVNSEPQDEFIHPIVKAILLHFWLAYIHPFMDGNGRTARAIFYWYVLKKKYWLFEYLSISSVILKGHSKYNRAFLYSEMDDGDMTYFISFHLQTIDQAIEELNQYLKRKQKESREAVIKLSKYPYLNARQRKLLLNAIDNPDASYTFRTHKETHGVVYQTARNDLFDLVEKGLLEKIKIGNKFSFRPVENLKSKLES